MSRHFKISNDGHLRGPADHTHSFIRVVRVRLRRDEYHDTIHSANADSHTDARTDTDADSNAGAGDRRWAVGGGLRLSTAECTCDYVSGREQHSHSVHAHLQADFGLDDVRYDLHREPECASHDRPVQLCDFSVGPDDFG